MSEPLTPEQARTLLARAEHTASTTRAGASWPQTAALLVLGAASSLTLPALAYVPSPLLWLPLVLMFTWMGALFAFVAIFSRSVKQGFGRRWTIAIFVWGALWVLAILGVTTWFVGHTWFLVLACAALTVVTLVAAWIEARR